MCERVPPDLRPHSTAASVQRRRSCLRRTCSPTAPPNSQPGCKGPATAPGPASPAVAPTCSSCEQLANPPLLLKPMRAVPPSSLIRMPFDQRLSVDCPLTLASSAMRQFALHLYAQPLQFTVRKDSISQFAAVHRNLAGLSLAGTLSEDLGNLPALQRLCAPCLLLVTTCSRLRTTFCHVSFRTTRKTAAHTPGHVFAQHWIV